MKKQELINQVVSKARLYLIVHRNEGFVTDDNKEANVLLVDDIPNFIMDLLAEDIIPLEEAGSITVQYTVDNNDSSYEDMNTKFIVFNDEKVKDVIPFEEVISYHDYIYKGLSEDGFRRLLKGILE